MTVVVSLLVCVVQMFFFQIAFAEGGKAILWPINGIALACLLLSPRRHWPWLLTAFAIGSTLAQAAVLPRPDNALKVALCIAICNTLEILCPALVLPRFRSMDKWLAQPRLALNFTLIAVIAAPTAASLLARIYFPPQPGESFWLATLRWGAADTLGIALFTPFFLALCSREMWQLFRPAILPKTLSLLTLLTVASWYVFHQHAFSIAFAVYPLILVVSMQLGLSGAAFATNLVANIATTATLHGTGPFGGLYGESPETRILLLQLFLVLSLFMTLPISVARVRRLTTEAQLKSAWQKMEALASLDGLTGVANRRRFDSVFDQEWARARREQLPVALLMIDADSFKAFNDHYGHLAGDACLRSVAQAIAEVPARPCDLVARYGGEEFAILLPGSDAPGACQIAEAVRHTVYDLALPHVNQHQRVTVSIGVACMVPDGEAEPIELIAASDRALYRAKHSGRNRVQMALEMNHHPTPAFVQPDDAVVFTPTIAHPRS